MTIIKCPKCGSENIEKKTNDYCCCDCGYHAKPIDEIETRLLEQAENIKQKMTQ